MRFLDLTLPTPAENLALDEALLLEAEAGRGGEVLRLWEWPHPAVILGAGCRLAEDVDEAACRDDGVPILRRASGGGTVLLGPGCLLYGLVLDYERDPALRDISASYEFILDRIRAALADVMPGLGLAGTSDLAVGGRKVSGNAQQRKQRHLLHHGTLLYDFDLGRVGRYLHPPGRQPDYRDRRDHAAFLMNLPTPRAELSRRLRTAWQAEDETTGWPREHVRRLSAEKYTRPEWTRRR
jgi:lipoate-protein ligase A